MFGGRGFLFDNFVVVFISNQKEYEIVRFDDWCAWMSVIRKRVTELWGRGRNSEVSIMLYTSAHKHHGSLLAKSTTYPMLDRVFFSWRVWQYRGYANRCEVNGTLAPFLLA
jgi:hypothetical protein